MDWQELTALSIVSVTIGLMARAGWRRRRKTRLGTSCCGSAQRGQTPAVGGSIVYQARRGERPRIIVRPP